MKRIAVMLGGCGRMDGTEIQEAVLTLLSISQANHEYQCFSLDIDQHHVTNHLTNEIVNESRNMLIESARIARGDVKDLAALDIDQYDGLIIPGGNGVASNLFSFAIEGEHYHVNQVLAEKCRLFTKHNKPVGFICIAPIMIPEIYDFSVEMTVGNDPEIIKLVQKKGAVHHICSTDQICVDKAHKIISTPAYMLANNIFEVYTGINQLVHQVIQLA